MGKDSQIAWCDHTFNPWWGCTKVSPACTNCYANWYEAAHTAGKAKLIEYAVNAALEKARAAAIQYAARIDDLALAVDDNDPRVMSCAEPIGAAQAILWDALGMLERKS